MRNPNSDASAREKGDLAAEVARLKKELRLVVEGKSHKEIGYLLHVSVKTVSSHQIKLMDKLDIHSISGLTKYAVQEGLTPPAPETDETE